MTTRTDTRKIITRHERESGSFAWAAERDEWDLGDKVGFGRTEDEAVADLMELEGRT